MTSQIHVCTYCKDLTNTLNMKCALGKYVFSVSLVLLKCHWPWSLNKSIGTCLYYRWLWYCALAVPCISGLPDPIYANKSINGLFCFTARYWPSSIISYCHRPCAHFPCSVKREVLRDSKEVPPWVIDPAIAVYTEPTRNVKWTFVRLKLISIFLFLLTYLLNFVHCIWKVGSPTYAVATYAMLMITWPQPYVSLHYPEHKTQW